MKKRWHPSWFLLTVFVMLLSIVLPTHAFLINNDVKIAKAFMIADRFPQAQELIIPT